MTTIVSLPLAVYPAGTTNVPATSVADGVTQMTIKIARATSADPTIWPNATDSITIVLETSLDAGVTWQPWVTAQAWGGIDTIKGTEVAFSSVSGTFPAGTNRRVRGSITLSANIKSSLTVDAV